MEGGNRSADTDGEPGRRQPACGAAFARPAPLCYPLKVLAPAVNYSSRVSALEPTAVNAILAEVRECQAQGRKLVSLMRGEPDLATPPHIVEACTRALKNGRTGYPDNRGEKNLREAVALKLERDNGLRFDPASEILATSGATFGIYAALTALLNPGDEVLLPDPIYDAYQSPVRLAGGTIRPVASRIVNGRFAIDMDSLEAAWSPAARLLILNTPWNPAGTVLTREELRAIAGFCERRNVLLVSDEIYESITYGRPHVSPLAAAPELRERSVLVNSLSKTYAMTGWRVGYCAGPAQVIQAMYMVLAQSSRGPATFIQDAAAEALAGPQDCVAAMREEYARRRETVLAALAGVPRVSVLAPEGGFFAMADVREIGLPSNEIRRRLMREHGVVVVHGSAYGPAGEGTLRVSFASGGDNLALGLARLKSGLAAIGS
jgi:aspartate/methionine/tyrosine aminotransferase